MTDTKSMRLNPSLIDSCDASERKQARDDPREEGGAMKGGGVGKGCKSQGPLNKRRKIENKSKSACVTSFVTAD
jgi:hypothetical protein